MNFYHTGPSSSRNQSVPLKPITAEDGKVEDEQSSLLCADAGKNRDTALDREETQCSCWVAPALSVFLNSGNSLIASAPFISFPISSVHVSSCFDEAQKEREDIMKTLQMINLRGKKSNLLLQKALALKEKANEAKVSAIQVAIQRVEEEIASYERKIAERDESHVSFSVSP